MSGRASRTAEIVNQRGLHARASAAFAREAARFDAKVTVKHEDMSASAASIMDLMMLAASKGCVIEIEAEGAQAAEAVGSLGDLVARRFDEES
jgi:phosphocarrier protein